MTKKCLVGLLAILFFTSIAHVHAQQTTRIPRIGYLSASGGAASPDPQFEAFAKGMLDLGYIDGKNIEIAVRYAEGNQNRIPDLIAELTRVGILYDPAVPIARQLKNDLPVEARALGLTIQLWEIRTAEDFERVFAALNKERPDGLYASPSLAIAANGKRIADFALKKRLPSMYSEREAVDAGGLMYYGADLTASYRRVASYVDRILKGANPADLPIEQPTKFEFIINLRTAKQISLTIPPNVLARADRVIR